VARSRFVVVAGTDTGVGKTFVACALARALARAGRRVLAVKPVESGCTESAPEQEDGALLAVATGQPEPRRALVRLRAPIAPALAAEREGVALDVDALAASVKAMGATFDVVLVEGAGGLLSPLSWTRDVTHLAHGLDAGVLLVAADRLGVIHHVRAAVQVLFDTYLSPEAIVLSSPEEPDASTATNAAALARVLAAYGEVASRVVRVPRAGDVAVAVDALTPVVAWLAP
jgi:dethiobiotin synthetase